MALIIFKYCLPMLLGYTFFVGIAGKYNPFRRPKAAIKHPLWFLGLWVGMATTIIATLGLHLAYQMSLDNLPTLVTPGLAITAAALLPGLIGFFWYRSRVIHQSFENAEAQSISAIDQEETVRSDAPLKSDAPINDGLDATMPEGSSHILNTDEHNNGRSEFLDNADIVAVSKEMDDTMDMDETVFFDMNTTEPLLVDHSEQVLIEDQAETEIDFNLFAEQADIETVFKTNTQPLDAEENLEAVGCEDESETVDSASELVTVTAESEPEFTVVNREVESTLTAVNGEVDVETDIGAESELEANDSGLESTITAIEKEAELEPAPVTSVSESELATIRSEAATELATFKSEVEAEAEAAINSARDELARETAELCASRDEVDRLHEELDSETNARKELETHLRITRNGLGALESESREFESNKAAAMIQIEQQLEEKVKRTAAAEARAEREMTKRADLETEMVQLREDALKATTDRRVSVEARAAALSTAKKATTFARQAIKIRTRLESQLNDAKKEIDNKQATVSSLIKALEKEKSRTQEDVASMAKQLRLHEKQLQARRTLEEVSRSVDSKLSTRLVKKVARARG